MPVDIQVSLSDSRAQKERGGILSMPTALLSLYDKTGLAELANGLHALGWNFLASGGTAAALRSLNLPVEEIAAFTGSPEILGGRVKTLHPAVHAGILSRSTAADLEDLQRVHSRPIDLVVSNLYPFEETIARPGAPFDEAIEMIDIGGVTLIRAAAKNHTRVTILTDPTDYPLVLDELNHSNEIKPETRQRLALKAFRATAHYDRVIAAYLEKTLSAPAEEDQAPDWLKSLHYTELRYGENPHQSGRLYHFDLVGKPLGGEMLQGKALSYTNVLDLDAAWRAATMFERPTVVIVKHLSPCGVASADSLDQAFSLALASDPVSAYGGVIAANRPIDAATVQAIGSLFVEGMAAPGFNSEAAEWLASHKKNCRLIIMPDTNVWPGYELRSVNHGLLWQSRDQGDPPSTPPWTVVTQRQPSSDELRSLQFAWKACQHVKSNAIVFAQGEATVGIGGGQPNRVDCVRIAIARAGERARGAVMASDAFFPFADSVEEAARAGIIAIAQPGGSMRDAESIAAADNYGVAMLFTGVRHFRH